MSLGRFLSSFIFRSSRSLWCFFWAFPSLSALYSSLIFLLLRSTTPYCLFGLHMPDCIVAFCFCGGFVFSSIFWGWCLWGCFFLWGGVLLCLFNFVWIVVFVSFYVFGVIFTFRCVCDGFIFRALHFPQVGGRFCFPTRIGDLVLERCFGFPGVGCVGWRVVGGAYWNSFGRRFLFRMRFYH